MDSFGLVQNYRNRKLAAEAEERKFKLATEAEKRILAAEAEERKLAAEAAEREAERKHKLEIESCDLKVRD